MTKPANRPIAGFECKMFLAAIDPDEYVQDELPSLEDLSEVVNARDVSIPGSADELDASARYSGEKKYIAGMFDGGAEFDYLFIRGGAGVDPVFDTLEAKRSIREPVCVVFATGSLTQEGVIWEAGWYIITKNDTDEAMGNARTKKYSLKPTVVFAGGQLLEKGMGEIGGSESGSE